MYRLLFILAIANAALAQCPDPNWEGTQCNPSMWWCQPDESCYWYGGWTSVVQYKCDGYDPSIGQFNSCTTYISACSNECVNHVTAGWKFDPLKLLPNLFPHLKGEWLPIGAGGRCRLVRAYAR